jgi:single-stranded-DNA-specific exonuclease
MAAGFTVETKNLDVLREKLEELAISMITPDMLIRHLSIDCDLPLASVNGQLWDALRQFEPFGFGNPKPNFLIRRLRLKSKSIFRGDSWTAWVTDGELVYEVIWDKPTYAAKEIKPSDSFDIVFTLKSRSFFGEERLVLDVKDLRQN